MDHKKIGVTIIAGSLVLGGVVTALISSLAAASGSAACVTGPNCVKVVSALNWTHLAVGALFGVFTLGLYMTFFSRGEQLIAQAIKKLEEEKSVQVTEDKFKMVLKALSESEQAVLTTVKENEGITQHMIKIRTNLSKAKVSQVLTDFQKKGLIRKEEKGKTFAVYLAETF